MVVFILRHATLYPMFSLSLLSGYLIWVGNLLLGFQDVAFLPLQASFSTTFHDNCCRSESFGTSTGLNVVGGKQWHTPCKMRLL